MPKLRCLSDELLPPMECRVWKLRTCEGLTFGEIARALGIKKVETVKALWQCAALTMALHGVRAEHKRISAPLPQEGR